MPNGIFPPHAIKYYLEEKRELIFFVLGAELKKQINDSHDVNLSVNKKLNANL